MMIHISKPSRRALPERTPYTKYRNDLRQDFHGACGYCGDEDVRVDSICFHIDHFAPKKRFPYLAETYSNLVYACRFCNIRKSDHWIGDDPNVHHDGEKGFIDPCNEEFDENIGRDSTGKIFGKTNLGNYIVRRLSLDLMRHQMLWQAKRARLLREEVNKLLTRVRASQMIDKDICYELLDRYHSLSEEIDRYEHTAING